MQRKSASKKLFATHTYILKKLSYVSSDNIDSLRIHMLHTLDSLRIHMLHTLDSLRIHC
jgi:hypothetical protein